MKLALIHRSLEDIAVPVVVREVVIGAPGHVIINQFSRHEGSPRVPLNFSNILSQGSSQTVPLKESEVWGELGYEGDIYGHVGMHKVMDKALGS